MVPFDRLKKIWLDACGNPSLASTSGDLTKLINFLTELEEKSLNKWTIDDRIQLLQYVLYSGFLSAATGSTIQNFEFQDRHYLGKMGDYFSKGDSDFSNGMPGWLFNIAIQSGLWLKGFKVLDLKSNPNFNKASRRICDFYLPSEECLVECKKVRSNNASTIETIVKSKLLDSVEQFGGAMGVMNIKKTKKCLFIDITEMGFKYFDKDDLRGIQIQGFQPKILSSIVSSGIGLEEGIKVTLYFEQLVYKDGLLVLNYVPFTIGGRQSGIFNNLGWSVRITNKDLAILSRYLDVNEIRGFSINL